MIKGNDIVDIPDKCLAVDTLFPLRFKFKHWGMERLKHLLLFKIKNSGVIAGIFFFKSTFAFIKIWQMCLIAFIYIFSLLNQWQAF